MINLYNSSGKKIDNIWSILWILLHYNSVLSFLRNEPINSIGGESTEQKVIIQYFIIT